MNKKKQLLLALFMLIVSALTLTTASYAWFTANTTVTLAGLEVNVGASNGIQVSMDASNWKANLTTDDITGVAYNGHTNQVPGSLVAVSSAGNVDTAEGATKGFLQLYKGELETSSTVANAGSYILTAERTIEDTELEDGAEASTTGDFIAFDLFIQTTQSETIRLTSAANVRHVGGSSKGLENAARVAFVIEGNVEAGSSAASARALNGASNANVHIWEPNYDVHTAAAVQVALSTYGITTYMNTLAYQAATESEDINAKLDYFGIKAPINTAADILLNSEVSDYFSSVETTGTLAAPTLSTTIFTISAGITKVRVYAWVEGQDVDCENNASGTGITFNIQLEKAPPVVGP